MQGLGFSAALAPALGELYADKKERTEALKRHCTYYNAHPYMASPILGAVINLEEMAAEGRGDASAGRALKEALMGPYGSIGDGFFWGMLRPLAALIGIAATLFWGFWGPLIFLGIYNAFHIWMRWNGLKWGYAHGVGIIEKIASLNLPVWSSRGRYLASAFLGLVSFLLLIEVLGLSIGDSQGIASAGATRAGATHAGATRASAFLTGLLEGSNEWAPLLIEAVFIVLAIILSAVSARWPGLHRLIYVILLPALILGIVFS